MNTTTATNSESAQIRSFFREACHGGGAEARNAARRCLKTIAARRGMLEGELIRAEGLDLAAYFASRPIT